PPAPRQVAAPGGAGGRTARVRVPRVRADGHAAVLRHGVALHLLRDDGRDPDPREHAAAEPTRPLAGRIGPRKRGLGPGRPAHTPGGVGRRRAGGLTRLRARGVVAAACSAPAASRASSIVARGASVPRGTSCDCTPYPPLTADDLAGTTGKKVTSANDS